MAGRRSLDHETRLDLIRVARRLSRRLPRTWDRRVRELGKAALNYRGARASLLRAPLYSVLGKGSPLLAAPFGRGQLLVDAADEEIGRVVFMTGGYERAYMESTLSFLSSSAAAPGGTFLDIGANIGTSTVDALLHFGFEHAICFEPDARNLRLLRMNIVLNDLGDRVQVHPVALSDRDGEAALGRSHWNFGDSRLLPGFTVRPDDAQPVPCTRLDSLVEDGLLPTDQLGLVWIDVQGHEPFVLSGATAIVDARVPIVIEYSPGALRSSASLELLEELVSRHFSTVVDVRLLAHGVKSSATVDAADVATLRDRYGDADHTDLLLLR